jgi:hypothetical protein
MIVSGERHRSPPRRRCCAVLPTAQSTARLFLAGTAPAPGGSFVEGALEPESREESADDSPTIRGPRN